jgi:hypothetical protein
MRRSISVRFISCVIAKLSDSVKKKTPSAQKTIQEASASFPAFSLSSSCLAAGRL